MKIKARYSLLKVFAVRLAPADMKTLRMRALAAETTPTALARQAILWALYGLPGSKPESTSQRCL